MVLSSRSRRFTPWLLTACVFAAGSFAACSSGTVESASGSGVVDVGSGEVFASSAGAGGFGGGPSFPITAKGVAVGRAHACALTTDDTFGCWGAGDLGQLGDQLSGAGHQRILLNLVPSLGAVTLVRAAGDTSCVVLLNNQVSCWGDGAFGQLGDGVAAPGHLLAAPTPLPGLDSVVDLALGGGSACAARSDGAVLCWGKNDAAGHLGFASPACGPYPADSGDPKPVSIPCESQPRLVPGVKGAVQLATSGAHTCALDGAGAVVCWGAGDRGQLGDGAGQDSATPVAVAGLSGASAVAVGDQHSCALKKDGTVACWGDGSLGQLGDGKDGAGQRATKPAVITGLDHVISLDARGATTCVTRADGSVECWGAAGSVFPSLPDPAKQEALVPTVISGPFGAEVRLGDTLVCARVDQGAITCWDRNDRGQLGTGSLKDPDYSFNAVRIPASP